MKEISEKPREFYYTLFVMLRYEASARYTKPKADPSFVRMTKEEPQNVYYETASS